MPTRAVTYARVSSDDHSKGGLNLAGQLELCRTFALNRGYTVVAELAEDERGVSGTLLDSPALRQALDMAARGEYEVLVVREIDRFARSLAKQLIVEQEFHKRGIQLEFVLEHYEDTPEGSLHKNIKAVIAEFERVKINERTRRGRQQKVKSGNVLVHGKPPYGYHLQSQDGKSQLALDEAPARIVRMIFDWYTGGDEDHPALSSRTIARQLSQMAIPPPQGGSVWSSATVQHILSTETYAGVWHYGKHATRNGHRIEHPEHQWVPVQVPATITRERWDLAQQARTKNVVHAPRNTHHPYLLRNRITCAHCGSPLAARTAGKSPTLRLYYFCPEAREDHKAFIRADHIDDAVWNYLKNYLADPGVLECGLDQLHRNQEAALLPLQERLETVQALLGDYQDQLRKIADLYISGTFSRARLDERRKELERKLQSLALEDRQLTERLRACSYPAGRIEALQDLAREIRGRLERADHNFEHRRKIVEFLDVQVALGETSTTPTAHIRFAFDQTDLFLQPHPHGVHK